MDYFLKYVARNYTPNQVLEQCFKHRNLCSKHRKTLCELMIKKHGYTVDGSFDVCTVFFYLHKVFNVSYIRNMDPYDEKNIRRIHYIADKLQGDNRVELLKFIKANKLYTTSSYFNISSPTVFRSDDFLSL
ncbi:hypothetical protein EB118_15845 [bacterium]|nr:hypothetical protein [bacterium]NDD83766.1 hypothetical protein [bacterium]NDG31528.1 hypothetical protein [bacterium]